MLNIRSIHLLVLCSFLPLGAGLGCATSHPKDGIVTSNSGARNLAGELMPAAPLGMKLIRIDPVTFQIGGSAGNSETRQVGTVTLTRPIEIQTNGVTQSQYKQITKNNPSHIQSLSSPVDTVSWEDAQMFISDLNRMFNPGLDCETFEKARVTQGCYRLPTEVEWEYAVSYLDRSVPCSTGDLWQWVQDWYVESSDYLQRSAVSDPLGPLSGSHRVIRSGPQYSNLTECSVYRSYQAPSYRLSNIGFRLVRTL